VRAVVLDPEMRRDLMGWRDRSRVELTQATRDDPGLMRSWRHDSDPVAQNLSGLSVPGISARKVRLVTRV
jgi:hypothetical protein